MGDLPIRIRVNGQIPGITSCQLTSLLDSFSVIKTCKTDTNSGKVLFSFGNFTANAVAPLSGEMATVTISMPPSSVDRLITVDWDVFPPLHNEPPTYIYEYSHYPLLVEPDKTAWTPALVIRPECCVGIRGNVDADTVDAINISDVTFLVDYLFRQGLTPPCFEESDANGNGSINIADLTYLIGFLFRGDPPPLCP